MNKRKLQLIEMFIKKYRYRWNYDCLLNQILFFINCDIKALKIWEERISEDNE